MPAGQFGNSVKRGFKDMFISFVCATYGFKIILQAIKSVSGLSGYTVGLQL